MSLDTAINFGTIVAGSPTKPGAVNGTYFYARWTGYLVPTISGKYTIGVNAADGVNVFVGGSPIVQALASALVANTSPAYNASSVVEMQAGVFYPITVEWQHGTGAPYQVQLLWTPPGGSVQVIPSANLSTSQASVTSNITGAWWNGTPGLWYPFGQRGNATTAPTAPTVVTTATPLFGGVQFSFNQLALTTDIIGAYKIYRNTVNNSGTASVIDTVLHDPKNAGIPIVVQDSNVIANVTYFYWVSAVNVYGVESALTSAGSASGNFSVIVETINLFGNPSTQGTGALPAFSSTVEQWQELLSGTGGTPEYRNGREIRIPLNVGGTSTRIGQFKSLARFKPNATVTVSFRIRRAGLVLNPTGNIILSCFTVDDVGFVITSPVSKSLAVSVLDSVAYTYVRYTVVLTLVGGQKSWFFGVDNASTQDDVYITEPMLNVGADSAPFTTNTFLTDVAQYAYEGGSFVQDDFTDTSGTALSTAVGSHRPSFGGVANAGAGQMWANIDRTASGVVPKVNGSNKASFLVLTTNVQNIAKSNTVAASVAYTVKADCVAGAGTGSPSITAGIVARCLDTSNFYLATIDVTNVVTLFKCVAGVVTSLGTFTHTGPSATLSLQVTDGAKIVLVNGIQKISSADNALTAAGSPGLWLSQSATSITSSPTVDNFSAMYVQNVAAPPTPPATPPTPPPPIVYNSGTTDSSGTGGTRELGKL